MRRALAALAHRLHASRCATGCFCVKDRFAWRCKTCGHLC